jgi:hypothetical protein
LLLKHVSEGQIEGRVEVTGRRGRRRKQLTDDLEEMKGYLKLQEEALDRTVWRTRLGGGYGQRDGQQNELFDMGLDRLSEPVTSGIIIGRPQLVQEFV